MTREAGEDPMVHGDGDGHGAGTAMRSHSGGDLRRAVVARRTELGMTPTDLQRRSGLSARTVRDIEAGDDVRRFGSTTLARLDAALEWPPGQAYRLWSEGEPAGEPHEPAITEQMQALRERLDRMETEPSWAREWVEVGRGLSAEQRALVLALLHQLADRPA